MERHEGRATHGHRGVVVTLKGVGAPDPVEYEDTVELTYEEWCLLLKSLDSVAAEEGEPCIALLCKLDL